MLSEQLKVHFELKGEKDIVSLTLVQFSRLSCMAVYQAKYY